MKTRLIAISLLLGFFSVNAFSQSILAGTHGSNDYYYDIIPDTSIFAVDPNGLPYYDYPSNKDSLFIDLNGDNINDFKLITTYSNGNQWYQRFYSTITPLNSNQVAISHFDSCFNYLPSHDFEYLTPMSKAFSAFDSINKNNTWLDSTAFLSFYDNEAYYITCYHNSFLSSAEYLGLKVLIPNDTLYGWIEVSAPKYDSLIVKEFACNMYSTGIIIYQQKSLCEIYPNPASDFLYIQLNPDNLKLSSEIKMEIYNIFGQNINVSQYNSGKDKINYNVSGLSNGIYNVLFKESQRIISCGMFVIAR